MVRDFYRYIVKNKNSYKVVKNDVSYGNYSTLADALYERDRLIQAEWDWEGAVHIEETDNPYEKMELPPFTHTYEYIYRVRGKYKVQKRVNGKNIHFGQFKTFEEAKKRRDELIKNGWKK